MMLYSYPRSNLPLCFGVINLLKAGALMIAWIIELLFSIRNLLNYLVLKFT